jgi:hypothetical protein
MPLVPLEDIGAFAAKLSEFLVAKHSAIEKGFTHLRGTALPGQGHRPSSGGNLRVLLLPFERKSLIAECL